jgi:hypothetical protein
MSLFDVRRRDHVQPSALAPCTRRPEEGAVPADESDIDASPAWARRMAVGGRSQHLGSATDTNGRRAPWAFDHRLDRLPVPRHGSSTGPVDVSTPDGVLHDRGPIREVPSLRARRQ